MSKTTVAGTPAAVAADATRDLPMLYRLAAGGQRVLGPASARLHRSRVATPLRRALARRAPTGVSMVEICGGRLRGTRMLVDLSCEKYYWLGTHEPAVQRWLAENVAPGSVVYDVGAHAGFFTLQCSALAGDEGSVRAFEPRAENAERLSANLRANEIRNVRVIQTAVTDSEGEAAFVMDASTLQGRLGDGGASNAQVATTTIDACVASGIPAPDVIKIDVEGAEGAVLRGAMKTMAEWQPKLLIEVHSEGAGRDVVDALPDHYAFLDIVRGSMVTPPLRAGHYAATPKREA